MSITVLEWKREPLSPQLYSEESWVSDDAALYWPTLEQSVSDLEADLDTLESKAEVASKLLDDLDNLNDLDELIKEEPFANWLEDKMIPIFEDVQPAFNAFSSVQAKPEEVIPAALPDTQRLLQEFETVYDVVESAHGTLTPPQSPTYKPLLVTLEPFKNQPLVPQEKQQAYVEPEKYFTPSNIVYSQLPLTPPALTYNPPTTPQPDVDHELAVVDELVRTRAEDMVQSPSSPCSSSSNFEDSSSDDPEWIPDMTQQVVPKVSFKSRNPRKPYSRVTPEDKKSRKKEQNKNAATRYRLKKKAEIEEILEEERGLIKKNESLENEINDLGREIKYLKGLMRELFKAKGIIN